MPTGKKGGQGQGHNPQNGGVRDQGWQAGQQIREGAGNVAGRLNEGLEVARDRAAQGYRQAEGAIARNPGPSVLISFGIGLGIGIALVQLLGQEEQSWTDRNIRNPIRDLQLDRRAREVVKNAPEQAHNIADAIMSHLPNSIRKHFS